MSKAGSDAISLPTSRTDAAINDSREQKQRAPSSGASGRMSHLDLGKGFALVLE